MTEAEKLSMVKSMLGFEDTSEAEKLMAYLTASQKEILGWRYSYCEVIPTEIPAEYEMTQVFAVIAGYSQSGAENQVSHNENGISRTFKYEDMIAYIRSHVTPFVGVI